MTEQTVMIRRKKHIWLLALCSLLLLPSCRPKGILHSGEMRDLLVDLHKTDAMIQIKGLKYNDSEIKDIYYAQVLERHGVTQAQFDSSLVWYTAHPQFFNKIYPKVLKELEREEAAFLAMHEAELHLSPGTEEQDTGSALQRREFTSAQLDSVLWFMQHGCPSSWYPAPLVHDTVDQFFPQIGVLRGGVVDTLETRIGGTEVADD